MTLSIQYIFPNCKPPKLHHADSPQSSPKWDLLQKACILTACKHEKIQSNSRVNNYKCQKDLPESQAKPEYSQLPVVIDKPWQQGTEWPEKDTKS